MSLEHEPPPADRVPCGCRLDASRDVIALVDPECDAVIELAADGALLRAYPHESPLFRASACRATRLDDVFEELPATLLRDRIGVARSTGQASSITVSLRGPGLADAREVRVRITPGDGKVTVLCRGAAIGKPMRALAYDASFWALFDAAPVPLAIETASTSDAEGHARLNRKFTEVFGYDASDVPSVQHWWPLAYADPVYRDRVRAEWFRRVGEATRTKTEIEPMETTVRCKGGEQRHIRFAAASIGEMHLVSFLDLTDLKRAETTLAVRVAELEEVLARVKALQGLLPLCAWCKKLRDDNGEWKDLEAFIASRTSASVTHGICPSCRAKHFMPPEG